MITATTWLRIKALSYDFLFGGLLLCIASIHADQVSRGAMVLSLIVGWLVYVGYGVIGHARGGQTPGKALVGIRVVRVDGGAVGWRESLMRQLDTVSLFSALFTLSGVASALRIPDFAAYQSLDWMQRGQVRESFELLPVMPLLGLSFVAFVAEVLVVLLGRDRRAVHDLVAGTRVIDVRPDASSEKAERVALQRRRWWLAAGYFHLLLASPLLLLGGLGLARPETPDERVVAVVFTAIGAVLLLLTAFLFRRRVWAQRGLLTFHTVLLLVLGLVALDPQGLGWAILLSPVLLGGGLLLLARPALGRRT